MHSGAFEEKPSTMPISHPTFCSPPSSSICPTKGSPENPQKYFQKVTFFRARKTTTQITTKNHQLTTFSPQKTSKKRTKTRKPPCKTAEFSPKNNPHTIFQ
jgi:hypothetical protein